MRASTAMRSPAQSASEGIGTNAVSMGMAYTAGYGIYIYSRRYIYDLQSISGVALHPRSPSEGE
jgi:hypothetical protein